MMSTLVAINALSVTRPAVQAPATIVAAWYERKAMVLHQIAGTCGSPAEHDTYESLAVQAHQHAVRLLPVVRDEEQAVVVLAAARADVDDSHTAHCPVWTTPNGDLTDQTCDCRGDDDG
jgi:hypothetical protein